MVSETIGAQARDSLAAVGATGRKAVRYMLNSTISRALIGVPTAHQLLLIPQDLRTADPSFASELYDGYFGLAGTVALTGSESPFTIQPPSRLWQKELFSMGWLHNLEAAGDEIAREKARSLIAEWIAHSRDAPPIARDVDIVARRVISILSHAGLLLEGAKSKFYQAVMLALTSELHYLTVSYADPGNTAPRLRALTALLLAGLCIAEHQTYVNAYLPIFCAELERQILPDGGHISRNPGTLVDLLLEFLPLKQCFLSQSHETPEALNSAIRRMMGMIRFLRLGDGSLARFNGMGATRSDLTAAVLAYADNDDMLQHYGPDSGYCRLERGKIVIIADTGPPPPSAASSEAHAGFLAFEMTSDIEPIIVNCGAPRDDASDWAIASRSTAAHSTLTISEMSSSRLVKRRIGYPPRQVHLLSGPRSVRGEVKTDQGDLLLRAMHDGYKDTFGFFHQRRLRLAANGRAVEGVDQLACPPQGRPLTKEGDSFAIRFHLHPRVSPRLDAEENSVSLTLPDAQLWKFRAAGARVEIEESIFLADPIIQKRSLQIVLRGKCTSEVQVVWSLRKIDTNVRDPSRSGYRGPRELEDES
ncbi:MAG: heparinase II/III family protein [Rhodomicrobiaceae bacterium]